MGTRHEQSDTLRDFSLLLAPGIEDERIDLLRAALLIARAEFPELVIDDYVHRVDELAQRVRGYLSPVGDSGEIIAAVNRVLFAEEGLRGNTGNYYDPQNSYLNCVLDRRVGIPISLAVIYMEVARRAGLPLFGVGMPGHFLLKFYDVDGHQTLIDAFSGGEILTDADCQLRLDKIYRGQMPLQPEFLNTVSRRQILTRMLNNLKNIFITRRNLRKALTMTDFILAMYPRSPEDVKQRAILRYNLGVLKPSADDLDEYLKMMPEASDADEIRQISLSIRRLLASMN